MLRRLACLLLGHHTAVQHTHAGGHCHYRLICLRCRTVLYAASRPALADLDPAQRLRADPGLQ
jgi:hypothetical protein